jgi:hypothetical protein
VLAWWSFEVGHPALRGHDFNGLKGQPEVWNYQVFATEKNSLQIRDF